MTKKLIFIIPAALLLGSGLYYTSRIANSQKTEITSLKRRIADLESEDQRAKNKQLSDLINQIKKSYKKSITVYQDLLDLKTISKNTLELDKSYAAAINFLSQENYASSEAKLDQLSRDIVAEKQKAMIPIVPSSPPIPVTNTPPSSSYARQSVKTDVGDFVVSLVSADLATTKIIVDTASESSCSDNCPVLPLATYITRSGAFAGVNGSYFCPGTYPTCAGKTNSFDLLVMNKNKTYFNSDNNLYSNNPGVIFGGGYIRFVTAVKEWGRDTGIDSMLSNYPMLVQGKNIATGESADPKQASRGNRSFVGNLGNIVYIGVVHSATVAESAHALKALGLDNALNLDDGGSTALWSGGYKLGPGRDLPNVILFVKK